MKEGTLTSKLAVSPPVIKNGPDMGSLFYGGEGGIRTLGESPHAGFQDQYHQPLGHLSVTSKLYQMPPLEYSRKEIKYPYYYQYR